MRLFNCLIALFAVVAITACSSTMSPSASAPSDGSSGTEYAYDAAGKSLTVTFPTAAYRYDNVPASVADKLMAAESKGSAYNQLIKGKYPETKLD